MNGNDASKKALQEGLNEEELEKLCKMAREYERNTGNNVDTILINGGDNSVVISRNGRAGRMPLLMAMNDSGESDEILNMISDRIPVADRCDVKEVMFERQLPEHVQQHLYQVRNNNNEMAAYAAMAMYSIFAGMLEYQTQILAHTLPHVEMCKIVEHGE